MQDESQNNHEREEDVERKTDREICNVELGGVTVGLRRRIVDEGDTRRCVGGINQVLVTIESQRARTRTQRCDVYQAGEGDDPVIHRINSVAAIELEGNLR